MPVEKQYIMTAPRMGNPFAYIHRLKYDQVFPPSSDTLSGVVLAHSIFLIIVVRCQERAGCPSHKMGEYIVTAYLVQHSAIFAVWVAACESNWLKSKCLTYFYLLSGFGYFILSSLSSTY